jgi:hypothetical protein
LPSAQPHTWSFADRRSAAASAAASVADLPAANQPRHDIVNVPVTMFTACSLSVGVGYCSELLSYASAYVRPFAYVPQGNLIDGIVAVEGLQDTHRLRFAM